MGNNTYFVERNMKIQDQPGWKITFREYLMGRDRAVMPTNTEVANMTRLLVALNALRHAYGKPMTVSSGWRPPFFNSKANGARRSAHITGEACDFVDTDGQLAAYCLDNLELLEKLGLYLENPEKTKGWVHLQTRKTASGRRVFDP